MKKYIIKNADGSEQTVMRAIHNSRKEAGASMMNYIRKHNENCDGKTNLPVPKYEELRNLLKK